MRIEVYGRQECGFCRRAAATASLLTGRAVGILGMMPGVKAIAESVGHTTIPVVFVDGKFLGGSDDLEMLKKTRMQGSGRVSGRRVGRTCASARTT